MAVTSGACKQSGQVVSGDDEGRRSSGGGGGWAGRRGSDKDGSLKTRREERLSKLGGEAPEMLGKEVTQPLVALSLFPPSRNPIRRVDTSPGRCS